MINIGTDIVSINKVSRLIDRYGKKFINKIFTSNEIIYCNKKFNPNIHFAGKFSAKESIKKALISSGYSDFISLKNIEIINLINGRPHCSFLKGKVEIKISISHSESYAQSMAIVIK